MLIFGFSGNISEKIASDLEIPGSQKFIIKDSSSIAVLLDTLQSIHPKYILGLGEYSGRGQDNIRIETVCRNKFRNNVISENESSEFSIQSFLHPNESMQLANGIGNSYCNLVSYKIMQLKEHIPFEYTFLHVPKAFNTQKATRTITNQLLRLPI
jgi:pyrrolidone-carboxylate peptidase